MSFNSVNTTICASYEKLISTMERKYKTGLKYCKTRVRSNNTWNILFFRNIAHFNKVFYYFFNREVNFFFQITINVFF